MVRTHNESQAAGRIGADDGFISADHSRNVLGIPRHESDNGDRCPYQQGREMPHHLSQPNQTGGA
jgi:hypothetical protein